MRTQGHGPVGRRRGSICSSDDRIVGSGATVTLLALMSERHPTVNSIAAATGFSKSTVYWHLRSLRRGGFIAFESERYGTIRPLVRRVR